MHELTEFGVVALGCSDGVRIAGNFVLERGVILASGRTLSLVDWLASSKFE